VGVDEREPGTHGTDHGVAVWSSAAWREEAVAWIDERLALAGLERTGPVEQPHLRPWATALMAPTSAGPVWLKAAGPGTAFEAGLYELLVRAVPDHVLTPLATDRERGWVLLPDGGRPLGERKSGSELVEALVAALVRYGQLQRALQPHADELVSLGVADMRPTAMPERFEQALAAVSRAVETRGGEDARHAYGQVAAMAPTVAAWCEELAASPVAPSLDHNDLHPWNILDGGADGVRYYDWGDSVVGHPLAAMLVPLGFVQRGLGAELGDPEFERARDAYLEVFSDLAPHDELVGTLATACRVAKIARTLTWERAIGAARAQGEPLEERWLSAPAETLASLLDESYLGGG
jgi:hypothetical protein